MPQPPHTPTDDAGCATDSRQTGLRGRLGDTRQVVIAPLGVRAIEFSPSLNSGGRITHTSWGFLGVPELPLLGEVLLCGKEEWMDFIDSLFLPERSINRDCLDDAIAFGGPDGQPFVYEIRAFLFEADCETLILDLEYGSFTDPLGGISPYDGWCLVKSQGCNSRTG